MPIHQSAAAASAILISPVDSKTRRRPLFCAFGNGIYKPLADALGPAQPTYGLIVDGDFETTNRTTRSVYELAQLYLAEVRRLQPCGPYQLAGFCYAGRVALEMAQQLRAAGEEVAFVATFDAYLPGAVKRHTLRWLALHTRELLRRGPIYLVRKLRRQPVVSAQLAAAGLPSGASDVDEVNRRAEEFRRHGKLPYAARPFSGRILIFRAVENARFTPVGHSLDPLLGWGPIGGQHLRVYDLPGTHMRMLSGDNARRIAETLQDYFVSVAD